MRTEKRTLRAKAGRYEPESSEPDATINRGFRLEEEDPRLQEAIRELRLRRRRSRIPWVFLVYQVRTSALPPQKRRDVEGRAPVGVAEVLM